MKKERSTNSETNFTSRREKPRGSMIKESPQQFGSNGRGKRKNKTKKARKTSQINQKKG